jgi:hypothetical protein
MTVAYRALLRLYPKDHRTWFGAEMESVFEEAAREKRSRGRAAYLRFATAELAGLAVGSLAAWAAQVTGRGYAHDPRLNRSADAAPLPGEVQEAQDRVNANLNGLLRAIAHRQFRKARIYATEEERAREDLRLLRGKYNIAQSGEPI